MTLTLYGGMLGPTSDVFSVTGHVDGEWFHVKSGELDADREMEGEAA